MATAHDGSLHCDSNLVALVFFLFLGGMFLFSSLKTGVETTRVVARLARDGCRDKRRQSAKQAALRGARAFPVAIRLVQEWLSFSMADVTNSRLLTLTSRMKSIPSKVKSIPANLKKRVKIVRDKRSVDRNVNKWSSVTVAAVKYAIPYRFISHWWGFITRIQLPFFWMKYAIYMGWTKAYNCKLEEMKYPLEHYKSLCEFFLRPLKDGVRAVDMSCEDGGMVSPVDGKVLHVGSSDASDDFSQIILEQVKGMTYSLEEFVGPQPEGYVKSATGKKKLHTIVLYLAPGDYHYFHSPAKWDIKERRHFPGNLLPVRPWAVEQVEGLYCKNERVALNGTWDQGFFSFVAVGALNVGSIDLDFDPELDTNKNSWFPYSTPDRACLEKKYPEGIKAVRGQRLGDFNLGSTVVLVFETDESTEFTFNVSAGETVRVGERIGQDVGDLEESGRPVMCPPWPQAVVN
mmetsp:Transcript_3153/g.4542  ORF Transcript_3153/g.4542 Transcript_3153/m.4542 type:complete len:460 (+) Transcript_3153:205-1584(+)